MLLAGIPEGCLSRFDRCPGSILPCHPARAFEDDKELTEHRWVPPKVSAGVDRKERPPSVAFELNASQVMRADTAKAVDGSTGIPADVDDLHRRIISRHAPAHG